MEAFKPTALIGVSTQGGAFTEDVIRAMAKNVERPIIFLLSNPTDKAECTPEQAYTWTDGRALVACGVQFPDVTVGGKTYHAGPANNFYIFPAVGLAVYATQPKRITDRMFIEAARASADQVSRDDRDRGMLFPQAVAHPGNRDHDRNAGGRVHLRPSRGKRSPSKGHARLDRGDDVQACL